jgi:hypothetical protein
VATTADRPPIDLAESSAERRRRVGVANRRLGWALLPLVIAAVTLHYNGGDAGRLNEVVFALQLVYSPLALVHAAGTFYVYGWVAPARTLRVVHIWFGYGYLVLLLLSQTTFGVEPLHTVLTLAMFTSLAVHIGLGAVFAARRRRAAPGAVRY